MVKAVFINFCQIAQMWCKVQMQTEKWRKSCFSFQEILEARAREEVEPFWFWNCTRKQRRRFSQVCTVHHPAPCSLLFYVYRTFFSKISPRFARAAFISTFTSLSPPSFPAGSATSPPRELTELSSELIYCISASDLILHLANKDKNVIFNLTRSILWVFDKSCPPRPVGEDTPP